MHRRRSGGFKQDGTRPSIGVIKSAGLQCPVRHGPRRPRHRIQIVGFATDHHRAYSFHWLPVTSRMHDATIRCTASAILATLPSWNTNAFVSLVPRLLFLDVVRFLRTDLKRSFFPFLWSWTTTLIRLRIFLCTRVLLAWLVLWVEVNLYFKNIIWLYYKVCCCVENIFFGILWKWWC